MKKIIPLVLLLTIVYGAHAQLLVTDSSFTSFTNGASYELSGVDSTYHDGANCRASYSYHKAVDQQTQQLRNSSYTTYEYYANGTQKQLVTQAWDFQSNTYKNASRTTSSYYLATSKMLTSLTEIWHPVMLAWQNANLQTNTYDASGYLTRTVNQQWNTTANVWEDEQIILYYNKSNGLADSSIHQDIENNIVVHKTKQLYTYTAITALPFQTVIQSLVNNQWVDSARSTATYDPSNRISVNEFDTLSNQTQTWDLVIRQNFVYNANGNIVTLTQYIYISSFAFISQTRYKHYACSTVVVTPGELCPAGNTSLSAGLTGTTYQWQLSTNGVTFQNIINNANYSGTQSATLNLTNIPTSFYGYQYRCVVNNQNGTIHTIKFVNKWTGTTSNVWNVASNWSCGAVPDANTDAVINSGTVIVNSTSSVRSLRVNQGASVTTNAGAKLTILR